MDELKRIAAPHSDLVKILGNLHHSEALRYLSVSDIFCLPSTSEGASFALAESMAFGVTPLTSIDEFSEMLQKNASNGVSVEATGNREKDSKLFALQLSELIKKVKGRTETGRKGIHRARIFFNADDRTARLAQRILSIKRRRLLPSGPHADLSTLHYTQSILLKDLGVFSDYAQIQRTLHGKQRGAWGNRYRGDLW